MQGKGVNGPAYADLTRAAANDWALFAQELEEDTGLDLHFRRQGAFYLCFAADELHKRAAALQSLVGKAKIVSHFDVVDNVGIRSLIPEIEPERDRSLSPTTPTMKPRRTLPAADRRVVVPTKRAKSDATATVDVPAFVALVRT